MGSRRWVGDWLRVECERPRRRKHQQRTFGMLAATISEQSTRPGRDRPGRRGGRGGSVLTSTRPSRSAREGARRGWLQLTSCARSSPSVSHDNAQRRRRRHPGDAPSSSTANLGGIASCGSSEPGATRALMENPRVPTPRHRFPQVLPPLSRFLIQHVSHDWPALRCANPRALATTPFPTKLRMRRARGQSRRKTGRGARARISEGLDAEEPRR